MAHPFEVSPPSTAHPAVLPSGGLWTQPGLRVVIYAARLRHWPPDTCTSTLFLLGIPMPCYTSHCSPAANFTLQLQLLLRWAKFRCKQSTALIYSPVPRKWFTQHTVPAGHSDAMLHFTFLPGCRLRPLQQFLSLWASLVYSRAQRSYTAQCCVPGHPQRCHFKRSTSPLGISVYPSNNTLNSMPSSQFMMISPHPPRCQARCVRF